MLIKKRPWLVPGSPCDRNPRPERVWIGRSALLVLPLLAASAIAQPIVEAQAQQGPIDDTWIYLLEMFRMLLGM